MTSHLVEGHPLPDHVAGHLALELCNTKALWGLPTEREYFTEFLVSVLWAREHGVVTADEAARLRAEPPRRQRDALRRLRGLRAALFNAVTHNGPLGDVRGHVARAVGRSDYERTDGLDKLRPAYSVDVITDRCALAANHLLENHGVDAVGLCASAACGWVFLDPAHRRRWCTMAVCGNRAKARRYAATHR